MQQQGGSRRGGIQGRGNRWRGNRPNQTHTAAVAVPLADAPVAFPQVPASEAGVASSNGHAPQISSTTQEHLTSTTFASLEISAQTKRALAEILKYQFCTDVQSVSLPAILSGADAVVKAKTGTGKTLAFLIPGIEQMLARPAGRNQIGALIVSPTRELAAQIAEEAKILSTYHNFGVQVVVGGTNMDRDVKRLKTSLPDILVATPGRLNDLLQNSDLANLLGNVRYLVLDEADRLLDMGFKPAITQMLRLLPAKTSRQTVLFSATFPADTAQLADFACKPGHVMLDTIGEEEVHTATRVEQEAAVTSADDQMAYLWHVIQEHKRVEPNFKIIAFFVTARITQFFAETFQCANEPVVEMHSRKTQAYRTRAAETFRRETRTIMFSSDVSARGVDYPDVTLVVQVGAPTEKAQYIHRVGRTGRAGKAGKGVLLLADYERFFLSSLRDLPVQQLGALQPEVLGRAKDVIRVALPKVPDDTKASAYRTWLGFYKGFLKQMRWDPAQLVAEATRYSATIGCQDVPPTIEKKTVGKMGLKGVPGLNIVSLPQEPRGQQNGKGRRQEGNASASDLRATPSQRSSGGGRAGPMSQGPGRGRGVPSGRGGGAPRRTDGGGGAGGWGYSGAQGQDAPPGFAGQRRR